MKSEKNVVRKDEVRKNEVQKDEVPKIDLKKSIAYIHPVYVWCRGSTS